MSIDFNTKVNETECYLSREANVTVDGVEHNVQYLAIIRMEDGDCNVPTITEITVEGIPDLDDFTFAPHLSDEEYERRENKRDEVYAAVTKILCAHYKVQPKEATV